jgi:hypothetical protein
MPAVSKKQKRLMDAAAHNPAFAKKVGIPTSVAKDFSESSKGKKFRKGGDVMKSCGTKGYAKGGLAMRGEGVAKKGFAKGGMAMSGVPKKGQISASGPDTAGPQGKTLSQPVKKSVTGDSVAVRGVGAARARTAKIY